MRDRTSFAIAFLAVTCTAMPAFANPTPGPLGPMFLPSVLLLLLAWNVLLRVAEVDRVLLAQKPKAEARNRASEALILVIVSLFLSILVYLALAIWSFIYAVRMLAWAVAALAYRNPPPCLASIRPWRMIMCSVLLVLSAVGGFYLALLTGEDLSMYRGKMARAISEIRNADLALTKLLADTGCKDLHQLFVNPAELDRPSLSETIKHHTPIVCELLKKGKNAEIGLKPELRQKLADSYMDLGKDPWGSAYQFYLGPRKCPENEIPFRSYRGKKYIYDAVAKAELDREFIIAPPADDKSGFPAPMNLLAYIFSYGRNMRPDQLPWEGNDGDDINNWDAQSGWSEFY